MLRPALTVLALAFAAAVPSAEACDCGGCAPASCGTTSAAAPGGLLQVRPAGQRGPLQAFDVTAGRRRFALPPGLASADGRRYFAALPRFRGLRAYDARTGKQLYTTRIIRRGVWYIAGVSANGRYVALLQGRNRVTRVTMFDASRRAVYRKLSLHGWYDMDAISNDGRRVFLIQYLDTGGYLI